MTSTPWYDLAFGPWYEKIYAHRSAEEARLIWRGLKPYLPSGGFVLDIGCGNGRHMRVLQEMGFAVIGLDRSWGLLAAAQKGQVHDVVRGDMRRLPFSDASFNGALSMFTSFGYFDSRGEHLDLLCEWFRVLKQGGRLILDYLNPRYVLDHLEAESHRTLDDIQIHEIRTIGSRDDHNVIRKRVRITRAGSILTEYEETVALYDSAAVLEMGTQAGFKSIAHLGGYEGESPSPTQPRAIYVWES